MGPSRARAGRRAGPQLILAALLAVAGPAAAGIAPGADMPAARESGSASVADLGAGWTLRPALPADPDTVAAFGSAARRVARHAVTARWTEAVARAEAGEEALRACRGSRAACADGAMSRWSALMGEAAAEPDPARRLRIVNRGVNMLLAWRPDRIAFGVDEHWASPLESLTAGAGDCEDFAILKLWSLKLLGAAPGDMAVLVLDEGPLRPRHAVLSVLAGGRPVVLDNRHAVVLPLEGLPAPPILAVGHGGQAVYGGARAAAEPGATTAAP